jgi:hypothetical protein
MSVAGPSGAKKPQYFEDPAMDALYQMVLVLSEELAAVREQVHAIVELHASGKTVNAAALDAFKPNAAFDQTRLKYVERLLEPLKDLIERETAA